MGEELPDSCDYTAQQFSVSEYPWILKNSERATGKRGIPTYTEDVAQEIVKKLEEFTDQRWASIKDKKKYVARMIINQANDFCYDKLELGFEAIIRSTKASTTINALDAALLINELWAKLSDSERELLEMLFAGNSGQEIASNFNISPAAGRQRICRLLQKLNRLSGVTHILNPVTVDKRQENQLTISHAIRSSK